MYLLPLASVAPWTEYGLAAGPAAPSSVGLDALPHGPLIAGGFTLHQGEIPGVLTELVLADVSGLGFSGEDLSTDTMRALSLAGKLIRLPVSRLMLTGDESLYVLLEGNLSNLPELITDLYRVLAFDIPGLIGAELFVGAHLLGSGFDTWSFALLNEPPIVGRNAVDAPGGLLLFGPWASISYCAFGGYSLAETLKKANNAPAGRSRLLICYGSELVAQNFQCFLKHRSAPRHCRPGILIES